MNTHTFISTLRSLSAIPQETKDELISLAPALSDNDRAILAADLADLNTQLARNEEKQRENIERTSLMLTQIEEHDITPLTK